MAEPRITTKGKVMGSILLVALAFCVAGMVCSHIIPDSRLVLTILRACGISAFILMVGVAVACRFWKGEWAK